MNPMDRVEEAYLDNLIRLAYMYEDALAEAQIAAESGRPLSAEEARRRDEVYARFQEKLRADDARIRRERRARNWRRNAGRVVQIAACIVLLLGVATPIAIANIDPVRARVLRLLIDIKSEYTELSLVEDESAAFDVPGEWVGDYFPSYIPEKYDGMEIFPDISVEFKGADGGWCSFDECTEDSYMNINTEDAELTYEIVNGEIALVAERDVNIVTWANEERYFVVMSTESKEEALEIARSVKKIIK